jgi:HK97 family phage prohead protease
MPHVPHRETGPEIETRSAQLPVEIRASGGGRTITGYGSVFGKRSQLLGSFVEVVESRCWAKSAGDGYPGVTSKFNHDDMALLGTTASGSLRLSIDNVGLSYEVDLPDTSAGNDVRALAARSDISGSSVGFLCFDDLWSYDDGVALRTLVSCRLLDCSPVVSPAYPDTTASLRSLSRAVNAPYADVLAYSQRNELRAFFTVSDRDGGRPMSGRAAVLETLRKRWPAAQSSKIMSGRPAVVATLAREHPNPSKPRTPQQIRIELLEKRWGPRD